MPHAESRGLILVSTSEPRESIANQRHVYHNPSMEVTTFEAPPSVLCKRSGFRPCEPACHNINVNTTSWAAYITWMTSIKKAAKRKNHTNTILVVGMPVFAQTGLIALLKKVENLHILHLLWMTAKNEPKSIMKFRPVRRQTVLHAKVLKGTMKLPSTPVVSCDGS